jgi:hypothetical protein
MPEKATREKRNVREQQRTPTEKWTKKGKKGKMKIRTKE